MNRFNSNPTSLDFSPDEKAAASLLSQCPAYQETPLLQVDGIGPFTILAKDESARMGLGSFKALGGVYAVAQLIAQAWRKEQIHSAAVYEFNNDEHRKFAASMTFVCASAGNHGMSVAAGAKIFGAQARVHIATSVPEQFALRLREKDAVVIRSGDTYEESVVLAIADANLNGSILLADGSWPGYTDIPSLVMEGYTVMAEEMRVRFEHTGVWPSHVFLQAGVGGLAAAITSMVRRNWTEQPKIIIVEPESAPCLRESHLAGRPLTVAGPISNMGRLDCKQPSIIALQVLNQMADYFVTISDSDAANTVELARRSGISSTPSGIAGLAALLKTKHPGCNLNVAERPLVIISEGEP